MTSCPLYNNSSLSNTNGNPYALIQKAGKRRTKQRSGKNSKSRTRKLRKTRSRRRSRGFVF
jgi:hypothetical protein